MLLTPSIKTYPWGRIGLDSLVAKLAAVDTISPDTTYAELWMGAHPSGSSTLKTGQTLLQYIEENQNILGKNVAQKFNGKLPFLFKVLSVRTALSIQAHPDKNLAEVLHRNDPTNYPDSNHKPEMAIAVTPFEVLCGFRSLNEIKNFAKIIPELNSLISSSPLQSKEDLKDAFRQLLKTQPEMLSFQLQNLLSRGKEIPEYELIHRLNQQFPGDVGIFCVYFLQHFTLNPGEAIYLPANEPHAYLSGDCMECMANSDNVVRAGLTPKFKDVDVLTEMLTFESGQTWIMDCIQLEPGKILYKPPVEEFAVEVYDQTETFSMDNKGSCSVCIVLEGQGSLNDIELKTGDVIFIPSDSKDKTVIVTTKMKLYRAFCPEVL